MKRRSGGWRCQCRQSTRHSEVFFDRAALLEPDDSEPSEERWRIIGLAQGKVLFVVFTERDDDVKRIISARQATKREEREYFSQAAP